jgi:hypothetical protein
MLGSLSGTAECAEGCRAGAASAHAPLTKAEASVSVSTSIVAAFQAPLRSGAEAPGVAELLLAVQPSFTLTIARKSIANMLEHFRNSIGIFETILGKALRISDFDKAMTDFDQAFFFKLPHDDIDRLA